MNICKPLLLLTALLFSASALADTGTALKTDNLRAEPYTDARTTGKLARGEKLEILGKKGPWLKVKTAKATGWVRLLSVKRTSSTSAANQAAGVLGVATGRAGTGQVVATTGVRGLSEEELKSAKFNEAEVKTLEGYEQSAAQAQKFAGSGGLKPVKFPYLSAPVQQGAAK